MLTITVSSPEMFDESTLEFVDDPAVVLELEHSLVSLSKWESIYEKPFLGNVEKTSEESLAYIKLMCLTPNVPEEVFLRLTNEHLEQIQTYVTAKMTATWFSETPSGPANRQVITNELIYTWMIQLNIPIEMENWHLNRLFTLLRTVSAKNEKPKKMSSAEAARKRHELNEQRKAQFGTTG